MGTVVDEFLTITEGRGRWKKKEKQNEASEYYRLY